MKIKICNYKNNIFTVFYIRSLDRKFFSYGEFDFKKEVSFLSTEFKNEKEIFNETDSKLKVLRVIEIDSIEILFKSELKFEIHKFGSTDDIMKEAKAFKIDMDSIAECTHLTKYFGPYDITKTNENKFIFTKGDQSALLSKSGW